jgi:hypothetical protein
MRRLAVAVALLLAAPAAAGAQQPPIPIPGPLDGPLPRFTGAPATAQPLDHITYNAANPALAPDGRSGSGLAAGNGAASPLPGPLGHATARKSAVQFGTCASLAFDKRGRLLADCNGPLGPSLRLLDPASLATIATLTLPPRLGVDRTDLAGGTHFVVRADGSLLVPTNASTLIEVAVDDAALRQTRSIALGGLLASGERPFAVAAGFDGRDWVTGTAGTVIALPRGGGQPKTLALHEAVSEDLATDPSGTFVVTRDALYRLRADDDGMPRVLWRQPVARAGTPPAIVARRYVAVADGTDPARVIVARITGSSARRLACAVPVFRAGASRVTAHLVVAGQSIVVSNGHGYDSLLTTEGGRTSTGGIARVVVGKRGCRTAWTSSQISPSAQPVVSRATGLLYTMVKPKSFPDAWNLAAIDWRSGQVRFAALAGEGLGYNSEGSAVVLGPTGAAYAGSFAGVTRFADR